MFVLLIKPTLNKVHDDLRQHVFMIYDCWRGPNLNIPLPHRISAIAERANDDTL